MPQAKLTERLQTGEKIGKTKEFVSIVQNSSPVRNFVKNIFIFLQNIFKLPLIHDHCLLGGCGLKLHLL